MNPKNFDNLIDSVLAERRLPSGGKSKKERYRDPKTRAMLKKSVAKHDAKRDANGQTQVQKREKTRQKRRKGELPKPGGATCSKPGCSNKATEADHTSRSGEKTQNLCKSCHQKVTDQRRERKGLQLNSLSRAIDQVLSEADPGEMPRDFPGASYSAWKHKGGEKEQHSYKGRAKAGRFKMPPLLKPYDKVKYQFTLYHYPTHPQILILPKGDIRDDFRLIAEVLKPAIYHKIVTKDGKVHTGKIIKGTLEGSRSGGERLIHLFDVNENKVVVIPKFQDYEAKDQSAWPGAEVEQHIGETNFISVTEINDDDFRQYWQIHRQIVSRKLQKEGKSEFKEALAPRPGEREEAYESRIRPIAPRADLFVRYYALEINKDTGKYRRLINAGLEANISRIAILVPTNMGGCSMDLLGNITDVSLRDFLKDPKTGQVAIEPPEDVDPSGVFLPTSIRPSKKRAKKIGRKKASYLSRGDIQKMAENLTSPFSQSALEGAFKSMPMGGQKDAKLHAQKGVIRDIAIAISGKTQKDWNELDIKQQEQYLVQAEKDYGDNLSNYDEAFKKALFHKIYVDRLKNLGLAEIKKLKICSVCDGKKKIQTLIGNKFETEKCRACNATGLSPLATTRGYQPKRTPEKIDNLTQKAYGMMQKLFQAKCPVCGDNPFDEPCPYCQGSGLDNTKLQAIMQEWTQILRDYLGDDFADDESSIKFIENFFLKMANYERDYRRTDDGPHLGNDYAIVYEQEKVADPLRKRFDQMGILKSLAKGEPIRWGYLSRSEIGKEAGEATRELARERLGARRGGILVPYESKSPGGPRRTISVEKLYNERMIAQQRKKIQAKTTEPKGRKVKIPQYFIEIRRYPTGKKHFDAELRGLALSDPRLKKKFSEIMKGAITAAAMKEVFRNNKLLVRNATQEYEPKANEIEGIGYITKITTGRQGAYEHPGEQAGIDLAELRGEDYSAQNSQTKQKYQKQAFAMRLASQAQGVDPLKTPIQEIDRLWGELDQQEKIHYLLSAQTKSGQLIGGTEADNIPHRSYSVEYIDIEKGIEGKLILKANDFVNLVEPLGRLFKRGEKLAASFARKGQKASKKPVEPPTEMESLIRTALPARLIRESYSPDDIAKFID